MAVPLLLHGDAAFPGQGVVAETLNLQSLAGYSTGGTVHIITDNQVGFTTDPEDARSTPYASDLAKGFNVPIVHVNADDVEACIAAIRLSMAYRERWGRDVVIDLIGYRRYGHNETDEPAYTQPMMAAQIKAHPPVSEIYAEQLVKEGVVTPEEVEAEGSERRDELQRIHKELKRKMEAGEYEDPTSTQSGTGELDRTKSPEVETAVSEDRLRSLNEELLRVPESFTIHRKLRKPLMRRIELLDEGPIEYGHAEALAFASLLTEGTHIRLTGQDTERGTFSHRHLALYDEKTGLKYVPIQNLSGALAPFELHNSPLSEAGCLGLRVRLLGGLAPEPGAVGGAVRRLRQRRAGDHRQLHRLRRGEVGPDDAADPAACRTATRGRGPSTRAPGSSASSRSPPRATCGSPTRPPPPSTSTSCAARPGSARRGRWWCSRPRACCATRGRRRGSPT